jgi:hypothetical protein
MNPFSRIKWKRTARKAQQVEGGSGWLIASDLLVLAIVGT